MILDDSYFDFNQKTFNIGPTKAIQFGYTLYYLLYYIQHASNFLGQYTYPKLIFPMVSIVFFFARKAQTGLVFFFLTLLMNQE